MFFPLPPLMVLSLRFYQRVMSTSPSVSFSSRPSPGFSSSHLLKGFQGQRTECGPAVGQPSPVASSPPLASKPSSTSPGLLWFTCPGHLLHGFVLW